MKTQYISDWKVWKELGEKYDFNPYRTIEFSIDRGGGNSTDFEYFGDPPEEEE